MSPEVTAFFDPVTSTVTYVVADPQTSRAAVIDGVADYDPVTGTLSHKSAQEVVDFVKSRNLTVDFTKLDMATLKRYKRHYRLKTRQNVTKTELALAVAKHFASQTVDEADTISLFMYSARAVHYDRRDYLNGR